MLHWTEWHTSFSLVHSLVCHYITVQSKQMFNKFDLSACLFHPVSQELSKHADKSNLLTASGNS
jgi:hypothetical protein